jgi:hypothetical protein
MNQKKPESVQTSYVGLPAQDVAALKVALSAIGVETYTAFWRGCIDSFLVQSAQGELIAWPPSFALQDRSPEYVRLKTEHARRYLNEQDRLKDAKKNP